MNRIAFTADIEKAFLQISLRESDRDAAPFLWIDDSPANERQNCKVYKMTRVLFGVASSPFLLLATINRHLLKFREKYPEACALI